MTAKMRWVRGGCGGERGRRSWRVGRMFPADLRKFVAGVVLAPCPCACVRVLRAAQVRFKVNLSNLLDCLTIYGNAALGQSSLHMVYSTDTGV